MEEAAILEGVTKARAHGWHGLLTMALERRSQQTTYKRSFSHRHEHPSTQSPLCRGSPAQMLFSTSLSRRQKNKTAIRIKLSCNCVLPAKLSNPPSPCSPGTAFTGVCRRKRPISISAVGTVWMERPSSCQLSAPPHQPSARPAATLTGTVSCVWMSWESLGLDGKGRGRGLAVPAS